jgi:hypothetical protein
MGNLQNHMSPYNSLSIELKIYETIIYFNLDIFVNRNDRQST